MRLLYAALKHDYGVPERGLSFEHYNLFDSLLNSGCDVLYFDTGGLHARLGRERMSRRLAEVARAEKPDALFVCLFRDELDPAVLREISDGGVTRTVNWFCDDHVRFESFSSVYAPSFQHVVTTAASAVPKYAALGHPSVIKSQWACNHFIYRRLEHLPLAHDVTFVGQPHGNRRAIIATLRDAGIEVETFGQGWESGRVSQERMVEIFNTSRVNLNLTNASGRPGGGSSAWGRAKHVVTRALSALPGGGRVMRSILELRRGRRPGGGATLDVVGPHDQIKGRNFEVPGCGGFMLTGTADNLGDYFDTEREIATFRTLEGLIETTRRFLRDEAARAAVARAGHERTLREHTYVHRFREIFARMGLAWTPSFEARPGGCEEVS